MREYEHRRIVSTVSIVSAAHCQGSRGDRATLCWDQRMNVGRADDADAKVAFCFPTRVDVEWVKRGGGMFGHTLS